MLPSHSSIVRSMLVLLFTLAAALTMGPARAASAQPVTITIEVGCAQSHTKTSRA